ncbi:MAG: hypothetical protein AB8F34_14915 [Akkermansiaceae bacterium]
MKQPICYLLFGIYLTVHGQVTASGVEDSPNNQAINQITKIYELNPQFYHKAEEWVRIRDGIPDGQMARITVRGYFSSLGLSKELVGMRSFQIDPRKNTGGGPLLYIQAREVIHKRMKARHFQLTGRQVKLLSPRDIELVARLRAEEKKRNELEPDPFTEK